MEYLVRNKNLALWLILAFVVMVFPVSHTQAGTLTSRKDTLETSAFSVDSRHTIVFTTATALTTDSSATADFSFVINLPTNAGADPFTLPNLAAGDITATCTSCASQVMAVTAAEETSNGGHAASDELLVAINETGQDSADLPLGSIVTLTIGTGATKITNPANGAAGCTANAAGTADTCSITLTTSETITGASPITTDSGDIVVGFIEGVTVSATVDETLSFSMAQGAACAGDTGSPVSINADVTATSVPYSASTVLAANTFYVGCQDLTLSTNGSGGYSVTSEENTSLRDTGISQNISDGTCVGTCTESTGSAWATSTNNGFGYYCENITNTPCSTAGDTTSEYRTFACRGSDAQCDPGTGAETAQVSLTEGAPASASRGRIHYKLSFSGTQQAGTYSNTVRYIATATF